MARGSRQHLWRPGRDIPFLVLCLAVALSLVRSVRQPSVSFALGGTDVTLVPADVAFAALAGLALARLFGRGALPRPARALTSAAGAFSAWLFLSSAANGAEALVGAAKLLEYGVVGLGAILFVRRRAQLWLLVGVLVAMTVVADVHVLANAWHDLDRRQASFLGEHDFAALGTMSLAVGVALLFAPRRQLAPLGVVAAVAGGFAVTFGAALASLVGMWLALVTIVFIAAARRALSVAAIAATLALGTGVTAAALPLRSGDLGFLERGEPALSAASAGGWSQRLIYVYIGGRVFLDNPIVGTGWHGNLPPDEWARFLDDARRRFPDQPPRYFPEPTDPFVPQQTYDEVLFELGIVGALLFLATAAVAVRTAARVGLAWPRGGPDEAAAYLPAAWTASLAGALAGAALFGGIALAGIFWLTLGVVALAPSLVPPRAPATPPPRAPEPVPAAAR